MAQLHVNTECGDFSIALNTVKAPQTCAYFVELAKTQAFKNALVFRIVNDNNHDRTTVDPIHVVQVGTRKGFEEERRQVPHESTDETGLTHKKWTVSAARFGPGLLYGSFFVCMRDDPSLDSGGNRQADEMGFPAFGEVVAGFDTVIDIFQQAEDQELLKKAIRVFNIKYRDEENPGHEQACGRMV